MIIDSDREKLISVLRGFSTATGLNVDFIDSSLAKITNCPDTAHNDYCQAIYDTVQGRNCCLKSDMELFSKCVQSKKCEYHVCHAGLVDVAVPIFHNDVLLGLVIFGQMKKNPDFQSVKKQLSELSLDLDKMRKYYSELPLYHNEKILSIANIAEILIKYFLLENISKLSFGEKFDIVLDYIDKNYEKHLTVQDISKNVYMSKTSLYKAFQTYMNCTVNEYINKYRIEKAAELLIKTNLSIDEISQKTGFSSNTYFSKLFKQQKGISPLKFRKANSK